MQFVGIGESELSGVLTRLPSSMEDNNTDWEIEPDTLRMGEKLGEHETYCSAARILSACQLQADNLSNQTA